MSISGFDLPGGMLYVGSGLLAPTGVVDPALIDPQLRVAQRRPDHAGEEMGYWPSYSEIPAPCRAAYLHWLAGGRRDPNAYIGYVFLYFYGLERLVLVDAPAHPALGDHVGAVNDEVRRLLSIYGDNYSFRSYADRFVDLIETATLLSTDEPLRPPARDGERWPVPAALRVGLGRFARDGEPIPANWARAWAWFHPNLYPRTPQTRCAEEFDALFRIRYAQRHGDGITVRNVRQRLTGGSYRTASAGIGVAAARTTDLPDVVELAGPTRKLEALISAVTDELDAYSRFLGKRPDGRGSLPAVALLPANLINSAGPEFDNLRDWVGAQLNEQQEAVVEAAELIDRWPAAMPGKLARAEAVSLAQCLGHLGVGMEPDVRFGGPALTGGRAVLFREEPGTHLATASREYTAATTLLHLAVAVGAADGSVSDDEIAHLVGHLESGLGLAAAERRRLTAHLRWLVAAGVKLTGLKKRIEALDGPQRAAIADQLVAVAGADGIITPGEVTTLTKIFTLLGLDSAAVPGRLHAHEAAPPTARRRPQPATGPITVREAGRSSGYAIPTPPDGVQPARGRYVLDDAAIAAKLAETAEVSALLATIFTDDDPVEVPTPTAPPTVPAGPTVEVVAGLDGAHSGLLRALAQRDRWSAAEFADLAARFGVLPAGAMDVLNEAGIDAAGEPVADDDGDELTINHDSVQELLHG